jgi:hypothetical protein
VTNSLLAQGYIASAWKVTESGSKPKYICDEVPLTNFWITWFSVGFEVLIGGYAKFYFLGYNAM